MKGGLVKRLFSTMLTASESMNTPYPLRMEVLPLPRGIPCNADTGSEIDRVVRDLVLAADHDTV